jgi:nascent polypeptide-associated complex subunit alpha
MTETEAKKIVDEESDDDMPELDGADTTDDSKLNKSEKKARKALSKLGMKQIPGIERVTIKKQKNVLFVMTNPDVFKSSGSETYVLFGEAKMEDMNASPAAAAAKAVAASTASSSMPTISEDDGEAADETGLDAEEISTIMGQVAGCSRNKAIKALKTHGSVVDAIMVCTQYDIHVICSSHVECNMLVQMNLIYC